MPLGKNFKIWGVSYGLVGDLVMGLPVLTYFEKKYPGSYKIWAIEKKVGFMAPFFLNHPLIDRIKITDEWNGFGVSDFELAGKCNVRCVMNEWKHDEVDWYNYRSCVEETARIAGVRDLTEVLVGYQQRPKLYRWFDTGLDSNMSTYSKENIVRSAFDPAHTIAIFPFATATGMIARSPSVEWWTSMVFLLDAMGYNVIQFGMPNDPFVTSLNNAYNDLPFFDQVKLALSTKLSIGTDSGNMWVMGAYDHPAVHLITNWMQGHKQNFSALTPVNLNGLEVFAEGGANNISHEYVLNSVEQIMNGGMK